MPYNPAIATVCPRSIRKQSLDLPRKSTLSRYQGLGYAGISNTLAVEFDTYYNPEMLEPYENHVSVQTRYTRSLHKL